MKKLAELNYAEFVAENFGVNENVWKQIIFIVFKAINIFWRKCFVTNEYHTLKVCFFHKLSRHELRIFGQSSGSPTFNLFLCKDRCLVPRLTAVWRIVWYGVVWFGIVELDYLAWRIVWYEVCMWFQDPLVLGKENFFM